MQAMLGYIAENILQCLHVTSVLLLLYRECCWHDGMYVVPMVDLGLMQTCLLVRIWPYLYGNQPAVRIVRAYFSKCGL